MTHPVVFSRTAPYLTTIKKRMILNPNSPHQKTYHIVLSTEEGALSFAPGDSLGILPSNDPKLVSELLNLLHLSPETTCLSPKTNESITLLEFFTKKVNLARISTQLLSYILLHTEHVEHRIMLSDLSHPDHKEQLASFIAGKDLLDIFYTFPLPTRPVIELLPLFAPLLPRFYSISSSLCTHPEEIHLLVALSSHIQRGQVHFGVASHFLCNLAEELVTKIPLYIQPTIHFTLPIDPCVPIIMIGPGTGVAPFRAFLQTRIAQQASGKHWLFFGGRHRAHDFFYEKEWENLQHQGHLRLSTAFSRDLEEKNYVQHALWHERKDVWCWMQKGAHIYVCGDATHMAKAVEATLTEIIATEGLKSQEEAHAYMKMLKMTKHYRTDVY